MTSDASPTREAFVWIWLPGKTAPVVAGRVHAEDDHFVFTYGRSYLAREDAIPVYTPELPLRTGAIVPEPPLEIANSLRDSSPDAWGRRVIAHRFVSGRDGAGEMVDFDELTFMLQSGSDRIGALDFQASPRDYVPRESDNETLDRLLDSADRVDRGLPLAPDLAEALQHGTAIGGGEAEGAHPGWRRQVCREVLLVDRHLRRHQDGIHRHASRKGGWAERRAGQARSGDEQGCPPDPTL